MPFTELCHPLAPATCSHNNDFRLNTLLQTSVLPYTFFSREIFTYKSLVLEVKLILPFLTAPEFPGLFLEPRDQHGGQGTQLHGEAGGLLCQEVFSPCL